MQTLYYMYYGLYNNDICSYFVVENCTAFTASIIIKLNEFKLINDNSCDVYTMLINNVLYYIYIVYDLKNIIGS